MPTLKHPRTPLHMCDSQDDKLSLFQESPIPPPELSFLSRLFVASCIKAHQCIVSMGFSNTVEGSQFPAELPKLNFDPNLTQTPDCVIPNCPLTLSELT